MKQLAGCFCIFTLLISCGIPTRTAHILINTTNTPGQVNFVTASGYDIKLSRPDYKAFLKENEVGDWNAYLDNDTIKIDSLNGKIPDSSDGYFYTIRFIIYSLDSGKASVVYLKHSENPEQLKRIRKYYKKSFWRKGQVRSVYYYCGSEVVFGRTYARICF